jgi:hypothetical protein
VKRLILISKILGYNTDVYECKPENRCMKILISDESGDVSLKSSLGNFVIFGHGAPFKGSDKVLNHIRKVLR